MSLPVACAANLECVIFTRMASFSRAMRESSRGECMDILGKLIKFMGDHPVARMLLKEVKARWDSQ
jgi:hypothetical protein